MRRFTGILCILLAWEVARAAASVEEMRSAAEKIVSIKGSFIQEKQMPILARPLVARGCFAYQRPGSLRWEYQEPFQSVLLLQEGRAHRYNKKDTGWVEEEASGLQSMDFILQEISKWLNGRFEENPMFGVSLKGNSIVMTPKDKSMDPFIRRIELIMADQPGIMKEVIVYENNDSFTRFIFIDPLINEPISPGVFQKVQ
jgi:hypothetical protein